jgi:hypothetical protein
MRGKTLQIIKSYLLQYSKWRDGFWLPADGDKCVDESGIEFRP